MNQQSSHWWGHVTLVRPCSHYYGFIWYTRLLCSMWHSLHMPSELLTLVHSDMWTRCDRLIKHQQLDCPIESYILGPIRLSKLEARPIKPSIKGPKTSQEWKLRAVFDIIPSPVTRIFISTPCCASLSALVLVLIATCLFFSWPDCITFISVNRLAINVQLLSNNLVSIIVDALA